MRPPPSEIGPYRIVRRIGQGGAGAVFEGRQPGLERSVAVKVLHGGASADPESLARFQREAQLLARIRHPNVVAVHAVGRGPDGPWLACDLVEGRALEDVVIAGGLPWRQAVEVVRGLAAGAAALHAQGLVHRDIKPQNCMLRPDGAAVLLDFGLAREVDGRSLTRSGVLLGTPAYMPPEQVDNPRVDARADVYALAATLLALITGRAPFDGTSAANILVRLLKEPADLSGLPAEAPAALRALLRRALAKSPDERPASADALAGELASVLVAPPPPRRGPLLAGLAVAGSSALVLAAIALRPEPQAVLAPPIAHAPPAAPVAPEEPRAAAPIDPLAALAAPPPPGLPRLAAWRAGWAALQDRGIEASRRRELRARMERLQTGPLVELAIGPANARAWAVPVDGRRALVASEADPAVGMLDLDTGRVEAWLPAGRAAPLRPAMTMALARGEGRAVVSIALTPHATERGQELVRLAPLGDISAPPSAAPRDVAVAVGQMTVLVASPDGRFVAAGGTASEVVLVDVRAGRVVRRLPTPRSSDSSATRALAFAADGAWLVAGGGDPLDRKGQAGWFTIHALAGDAPPLESPGLPTVVTALAAGKGPAFLLGGVRFLFLGDARTAEAKPTTDAFGETPYGTSNVRDMDLAAGQVWTTTPREFLLPWRWSGELDDQPVQGRRRTRDRDEVAALRCTPDGALVLVSAVDPPRVEVWGGELPE